MSLDIGKEKCAVCKAYLFEDDDVVYCPECGAPHHRECYLALGHCGLAQFHGTENQYKKPESTETEKEEPIAENMVSCSMCGERYPAQQKICPNCNTPSTMQTNGRIIGFDMMGGVPEDTDLGNGVTAKEAKKFVATNTHRYIPRFLNFKRGKKTSWNWLAFFTPAGWLVSRKMYLLGAIMAAVEIALVMLSVPFQAAINTLDYSQTVGFMQMANLISENLSVIGTSVVVTATVGSVLYLLMRILIAIFGDYIYKNRVISAVTEINQSDLDREEAFRKKGGVSFFIGVLVYFAVSELPTIIAYTLGML